MRMTLNARSSLFLAMALAVLGFLGSAAAFNDSAPAASVSDDVADVGPGLDSPSIPSASTTTMRTRGGDEPIEKPREKPGSCDPSRNLLANPGFESGLMAPWSKMSGLLAFVQRSSAFEGDYMLSLAAAPYSSGSVLQRAKLPRGDGASYKLTVNARKSSQPGKLMVIAGGFTLLSVDLTSTFTPYTARFNASSTEVDVELVFSGWSLVDLVSLVCMDKGPPNSAPKPAAVPTVAPSSPLVETSVTAAEAPTTAETDVPTDMPTVGFAPTPARARRRAPTAARTRAPTPAPTTPVGSAFFTSALSNSVIKCGVTSSGDVVGCRSFITKGLQLPSRISVYNGSIYVPTASSMNVYSLATGALSASVSFGSNSGPGYARFFNDSVYVIVSNPSGKKTNTLQRCSTALARCVPSGASTPLAGPADLAIDGQRLYWTNYFGNTLHRCDLPATADGSLSNCTVLSSRNVTKPAGVVVVDQLAYVTTGKVVSKCSLGSGACSPATAAFSSDVFSIGYFPPYVYVTEPAAQKAMPVWKCARDPVTFNLTCSPASVAGFYGSIAFA